MLKIQICPDHFLQVQFWAHQYGLELASHQLKFVVKAWYFSINIFKYYMTTRVSTSLVGNEWVCSSVLDFLFFWFHIFILENQIFKKSFFVKRRLENWFSIQKDLLVFTVQTGKLSNLNNLQLNVSIPCKMKTKIFLSNEIHRSYCYLLISRMSKKTINRKTKQERKLCLQHILHFLIDSQKNFHCTVLWYNCRHLRCLYF